ncbi:hypothetical protein Tco_0977425 [Tanacetum coccineum]|uniref:Uncharacterized protein n=1 Tax=Tanacetum coccineum TaxID=301880 RepID=A0ABQ5EK27_9ASTR
MKDRHDGSSNLDAPNWDHPFELMWMQAISHRSLDPRSRSSVQWKTRMKTSMIPKEIKKVFLLETFKYGDFRGDSRTPGLPTLANYHAGTDISQKDEKPIKKRQNRTRDGKVCGDEAKSKDEHLNTITETESRDSSITSPKIDFLPEEFVGELDLIDLILPGINDDDFDEEEGEIDIDIFQIEDKILREKLLNFNLLIDKIEALNLILLFLLLDTTGIESDFDSEGDIIFLDDLLNDDPILDYERFTFDIELDTAVINNFDELNEDECFDPGGGTDISKLTRKQSKNRQARTRESEEYKKKTKNQSRSQKVKDRSQIQSTWSTATYLRDKFVECVLLMANIEALKDIPTHFDNSSGSTTTRSDYSLPDYEAFYDDHIEEKNSGSTTTHADFSHYDSLQSLIFRSIQFLLPIGIEPELGNLTMDVVEDILPTREPRVHVPNDPVSPSYLYLLDCPDSEAYRARGLLSSFTRASESQLTFWNPI